MRETTLCYIENDGQYLMLYRNKKKNDGSLGKWLGIGGKLEPGETPDECIVREILEETGLKASNVIKRGVVYFYSDLWEDEIMHLYTVTEYEGEVSYDCDEGILKWIDIDKVMDLNLWEGDRIFLARLAAGDIDFKLSVYYEGDTLVKVEE